MHEFARTSVRRAPAALACATPDGVRAPGSIAAGPRPVVGSPSLFPWAGRPLAVPGGCERTLLSRFLLHQHSKTRRELLQERGLRGCGPGGPASGGSERRAAGPAVEGWARGGERGAAPATCRRGARERARRHRLRAEAAVRTRSCDERGACRGARLCGQRGEEGRGQEVARWPPPAAKRAKKGQLRWWAGPWAASRAQRQRQATGTRSGWCWRRPACKRARSDRARGRSGARCWMSIKRKAGRTEERGNARVVRRGHLGACGGKFGRSLAGEVGAEAGAPRGRQPPPGHAQDGIAKKQVASKWRLSGVHVASKWRISGV